MHRADTGRVLVDHRPVSDQPDAICGQRRLCLAMHSNPVRSTDSSAMDTIMTIQLIQGSALTIPLADQSVHCIVTSPPYWGLRDYGISNALGSEPLHDCLGWATGENCGECYICHMRQVARECWRVLRDDGVMFWNIADSMYSQTKGSGGPSEKKDSNAGSRYEPIRFDVPDLKPKDKCGIPERTALAFQADGWYWRSGITWVKPNPMPESVTDRPTKSTEMIHLFAKSERYYWDVEAVRERANYDGRKDTMMKGSQKYHAPVPVIPGQIAHTLATRGYERWPTVMDDGTPGRNLRDAWTIATAPYSGAHFATFPPELPRRCIKAGTSERGACPKCGKPWVRVVNRSEKTPDLRWAPTGGLHRANAPGAETSPSSIFRTGQQSIPKTIGWQPSCNCDAGEPVPCIVLDPFSGAATTGLVARELGRHYVGLELSWAYLQQSRERLGLIALDNWHQGSALPDSDDELSTLPLFNHKSDYEP